MKRSGQGYEVDPNKRKVEKKAESKPENRGDRPAYPPDKAGEPSSHSAERPVTNEDSQKKITNSPPAGDSGLSEEQIEGA